MSLQDDIAAREIAHHAAVQAAERASLLLNDPAIKGALETIQATIKDAWADLPIENTAQAERLKQLLWAAKQFEDIFTVTIAGGHFAKNELLADNAQIRADAARGRLHAA
jgi:hypothetical protein